MREKNIRELTEDFINYKRSIGYQYEYTYYLYRYLNYVEANAPYSVVPTCEVVSSFFDTLESAYMKNQASIYLRELSRYLRILGYDAFIIPEKNYPAPSAVPPYLFTQEEITIFFTEANNIIPRISMKGRHIVIPAIFYLLHCCGLRCKEARTLKCSNVHAEQFYIDILQSKGPKSRRLYISTELAAYLNEYDEKISHLFPDREYFFPSFMGGCYSATTIGNNFNRIWMKAFPGFVKVDNRPRAYDFRHHFAWANINKWAKDGADVNSRIVYLMKYMGHKSVSQTLYYFHMVHDFFPELVKLTADMTSIIPEVENEEE